MSRSAAKRWCFTINNPTRNDEFWDTDVFGEVCDYLIVQEETGENGTTHYQGFLILKKPQRLTWLKNRLNERAHWEVARGTNEQARDYCRKEETYNGGLRYEFGSLPERNYKKRDERIQEAAEELDIIKETFKRPAEIPSMTLMQCGFLPAYNALTADILGPYRPELKIITMVGPPGCGKSYAIQANFPDHGRCIMGNSGIWFQRPLANVMVFEEFTGQIQLQRMLQFLDPYPLALEIKGGMRPAMYNIVIITSNTRPDGWYQVSETDGERRRDAVHALWDRIGFSNGSYIPVRQCGHYLEAPFQMAIMDLRRWFNDQIRRICDIHEEVSDTDAE